MSVEASDSPILLYDGVCGFCNKTVQFVIDHDTAGRIRFAALQGDYAAGIIKRHPVLQGIDSVVLVEPVYGGERVHIKSTAALKLAAYLGGIYSLARLAYAVPRPVRDWCYDLFARNRYRFFGRYDSCAIPPKEVRSRFIGTFPA